MAQILRVTYDYFVEHVNAQKEIQDAADASADLFDDWYIRENTSEYDLPLMDFYVHAPDYE